MKPLGVIAFFDIENRSGISAKRTSTSQITVLVLVQSLTSHWGGCNIDFHTLRITGTVEVYLR